MNAAERKAKLKEFTDHPETACRTGIPITYHGSIITLNAYAIPLEYLVYNPYNGRIGSVVKSYERQNHSLIRKTQVIRRLLKNFSGIPSQRRIRKQGSAFLKSTSKNME